jgi:TPR repeat protein
MTGAAGPISRPTSGSAHGNDTVMPLDSDEIAMLLSRAQDFLKSGDLASARLLLRRAAQASDANAALTLGATFDPFFVHAIGVGIAPDIAQARQWYEKAAELGSEVATERLARLAKTGR